MGLENLKSVFARGIGSRATSPGGRHGIDKHPPGHSTLDDFIGGVSPTPIKPIPTGVGNNATFPSGRHGGDINFAGQIPPNYSQLDNFSPFMSTFQITSDGSPLMNLVTDTNLEPAFPQNYTPINTLTNGEFISSPDNSLKNNGWPTLYNSNHTSITINQPSPRTNNPFQPFQYGNPNIAAGLTIKSKYARNGSGRDRGSEPYIVSNIGSGLSTSRLVPFKRAKTDFKRISKYFRSSAGLLELTMANMHMLMDEVVVRHVDKLIYTRQRFNSGQNVFSTLGSIGLRFLGQGIPNVLIDSGFSRDYGNDMGGFLSPMEKLSDNGDLPSLGGGRTGGAAASVITQGVGGIQSATSAGQPNPRNQLNLPYDLYFLNPTFTGATTAINDIPLPPNNPNGRIQKVTTGDKMTLAKMISGKQILSSGPVSMIVDEANSVVETMDNIDAEKEGMPLYFKDLRDDTYIFFRAYLEGLTEDLAPSWSEHNYIGRSEPVYTYERSSRTITFTLKLIAQTEYELQAIYLKMNRLTSLCYPQYSGDIRLGDKTRMKPPITKFRLGDLFGRENDEMLGFIEALNYSVPESSTWETRFGRRVPKHITANITYKVIHGKPPALTTKLADGTEVYTSLYGYTGTAVHDVLTDFQTEYMASVDAGETKFGDALGAKADQDARAHNEAVEKWKEENPTLAGGDLSEWSAL